MAAVNVPGVGTVNFPDSMSPEDMQRAIETEILPQARQARVDALKRSNPGEYDPRSADFQARYSATSGMGTGEKLLANVGAGFKNFGLGAVQLALPKSLEASAGITDESIREGRARDAQLAASVPGGGAIQAIAEALPTFAIPGGAVARGLTAIPRLGGALGAVGIGTRVLPTLAAEGATVGALSGAASPTTSDESSIGRAAVGAVGGAALPLAVAGAGMGLGALGRGFLPSLQRSALARRLGTSMDVSPRAQQDLADAISASSSRSVPAPQSLAALTQEPAVARMELASRANPDTAASWAGFDEAAADARWQALHQALGNEASVKAAKAGTNSYVRAALPELWKGVDRAKLANGVADLRASVGTRLAEATRDADPARQAVAGYVARAMDEGGGTPQMLWNVRQTLNDWLEGTPPPGLEGTRAPRMDKPILETRDAIDRTLNGATQNKWSGFLDRYSDFATKEEQAKAGQNIRNAFMDETLLVPRGPTTKAGSPIVTRAKLEQTLVRYGKNKFGEALDPQQRAAIDDVLSGLHADEVLQRVRSSMTGKGGSQTAPLEALMRRSASKLSGGGVISDLATMLTKLSARGQQRMLTSALQNPQEALAIMREADKIGRPLSPAEQRVAQAARTILTSPSLMIPMNQSADSASQ